MTVIRTSVIALTVASGGGRAGGCAIGGGLGDGRGEQVVPDQAQSLQSQLTALKDKFGKGEYEAVVTTWGGRERPPADPRGVSDECRQWWPFYVAYPLFGPGSRRALID
jgi:hypothetical protein